MSETTAARFVCINLASKLTGLTEKAIRNRIQRAQWIEGRQYVRRGGRVFIDMKGYEKWVMQGVA